MGSSRKTEFKREFPGEMFARGFKIDKIYPWPLVQANEIMELRYGKSLVSEIRTAGNVPVYGSNGQCGWHNKALFAGPGVVLGRKGQGPLGVEWVDRDYWVIDTAYSVAPRRADVHLRYAYYLLKWIGLNHLKDGTSNPSLSRDTFSRQVFPWPPLPQQKEIARIVQALDEKIQLNRRINSTLQSMARALFKSWFIDFDPVRAKSEGRDPRLPSHIANLFADELITLEDQCLPTGWGKVSLMKEFELIMGQSPPGETYNESGIGTPLYQGCADFGFRYPTRRVFCSSPTRMAKAGNTLVSVRAPVGRINIAVEDCAIGRGVASVLHKSGSRTYTYQYMRHLEGEFSRFEGEGTVFGSISKESFQGMSVIRPPENIVKAFDATCAHLDDLIANLEQESISLATMRDTLLPRLVSGEVRFGSE